MNAKFSNTALAGLAALAIGIGAGSVVEAHPDNPAHNVNPHYQYGLANTLLDNHKEAISEYTQAIALTPEYANAYLQRGISHAQLGRLELARSDFEQAIALDADYAFAHYNRGKTLAKQGDISAAQQAYRKAAALYQQQGQEANYQIALNRLSSLQIARRS